MVMKTKAEISKLGLYAVALAMGIASAVLSYFQLQTIGILLGIGIFCLGIIGIGSIK